MSHDLFKNHLSNATHNFDVLENKSYALVTFNSDHFSVIGEGFDSEGMLELNQKLLKLD